MLTPQLQLAWGELTEPIRPFLAEVSSSIEGCVERFDPQIRPQVEYALGAQGKLLRSALLGFTAHAFGRVGREQVKAAVIVEMVHLATLVHDDVLDHASIRRSRPTVSRRWGNHDAVLTGDCLFAEALRLASTFPTADVCRQVASSSKLVCTGEIIQSGRRHDRELSREDYFRILEMKTGELFRLSCFLAGYLAKASEARQQALARFGLVLGTAYQLYDDCVDYFSSEATEGKSLGTDLESGKITLPWIIAVEQGVIATHALGRNGHPVSRGNGHANGHVREVNPIAEDGPDANGHGIVGPEAAGSIVEMVRKPMVLEACRSELHALLSEAKQVLWEHLPAEGGAGEELAAFVDFLYQQADSLVLSASD